MSLMERLERLNLVDGQLRGLSVRVEKAKTFHRAQTKQLDLERNRTEEAKANLLQVKAAFGVVETEAKALDAQIETSRERMDTSATAKEYNALLVELNTVKNERTKLDETMVQQLTEVERLETLVTESESSSSERETVVATATKDVEERETEISERVSELQTQRDKAAADIPPDVLELYDSLVKKYDGEAIAYVDIESFRHKEFSCSACSMQIPFAIVSNLYAGLGRVQQCTNCQCIMLLGEDVRNELDKDSKKNVKRREKLAREA
ncbi:MAG: hypothetical protein CMJ28_07035 [Phycisphaerae bacterium]|nr:hypothetical protein [Phycisphaerae bacterium]